MSKKLILFLMVLLFGSTSFLRADELTIHDGTGNNSYVPVYGLYADAYLKCEMVFPAEELADMTNGTISGITFYATTPAAAAWTATWQVFVAEVENATISDFAGPGTVVYEGTLDGTQSSMTITFSAPYTYNGGNLLVGVYCTEKGNYKSVTWGGETVEGASVQGYNYNSLSGVTALQRDFLPKTTFVYTPGSQPTPPTGELTITPNDFTLGERPANGWMEPLSVRINNSAEPVTVTATLSNTSGVGAITMEPALIQDLTLETGDEVALTISTATGVTAGEYAEEFTMFTVNAKNIATIPVTATLYTAGEADIVETAKTIDLSYTSGVANFSETPANLHANYLLAGMTEMTTDAVYKVTLDKDAKVTVNNNVVYYNYVSGLQLSPAVEPAFTAEANEEITVLAGTYYMVVTDYVDGNVEGTVEQIPAPTALTALTPADGATEVESPVTLTWEGGENAAQYQVLFGTSPVNMPAVLDWTMVDENYGSYTVSGLQANTQYFWQIKAKNSNGTVQTVRRGFTTALTAPNTVTASATEIFTDESTLIKWKHSSGTMGDLPETQIGSGTSTNSYLPTYNFYNYSLSEQIYTSEELGGEAGYINSISFYPVGAITRNLKVYLANTDKETFTSGSDWVAMTEENLVYEGNVDMVANTWVTINFADAFEYEGGNLILAVTDHTGTYTSSIYYNTFDATAQAINVYQDSAPYNALAPVGGGTVRDFKNQIIINKDGAKGNTANRGFIGYNVYYGDVKANDALITEKQFLLENLPYNMTGHDINVTAVYDEGESGHSTPIVTVKVSGYATLEGTVTTLVTEQGGNEPLAGATVTFYGKDEFNNDVNFETTTDDNGYYSVTVKAGIYNRGVATYAGMEPASMAEESVTVAYEGTETVNFIIHEEYKPVLSVYAEEINPSMSKVTWSLNTVISGGGTGGNASTFTEGFESGMPEGWTVVDANNDGTTWTMTSDIPSVWPYYAGLTLDWYRTGTNAICSGSYVNGVGALNPDEYLVMGQQNIANGSTLSFWAAATDASYPADHFGVAVSDDATTWTMVQEWTLTGKEGAANGGRASRDGNGAKLGTWHNYTVDLSAYAGQKYIAIRHFNCYDQYIMCVDDIELAAASKDRSLDHYAVYRKAILKENEIVPADSVMLVDGYTDTLYADFDWNNVEPGLYQYGVQAVYPSPVTDRANRDGELTVYEGSVENSTVPMYVSYFDDFTKSQFVMPAAALADMAGSDISAIKFYTRANYNLPYTTVSTIDLYMTEVDYTTISSFIDKADAQIVFNGTADFAEGESGLGEVLITFETPYHYNGGNLLFGCENLTDAGYKFMYFQGQEVAGASVSGYNSTAGGTISPSQRNFLPQTTFFYGGGGGGNDNPVTPITWSNILPKDMETTVTVNAVVAAGTAEGATVIMTNTFEDIVFAGEFDETGTLVFPEFRKGNYVVTVDLEGYTSDYAEREVSIWDETELTATLTEIYKPVEEITVSVTGYAMWTPIVPVDRIAEKYFVQLNGVYYGETTDNFMQIDEDVLIENEQYTVGVAVVYSTGMSAYVTKNFTYLGCEGVATQVEDLHVDEEASADMNVVLVWNGGTPTPVPPTPPTGNTYDFDNGTFQGWTTIDANNDGYDWVLGSQIGGVYLVAGASLAGSGHNSSADLVCSGSYSNATGATITPDNYLVSPAKAEYTGISFWACAQDASYPAEHFGVAVSTGNTVSDFVMVQEWTMTAKSAGAMSIGRGGEAKGQGSWHEYTVDLSAYAGQEIWVAIRHFNCNDQFILNVDDITLGVPEKATMDNTPYVSAPAAPAREMWDLLGTFNAAEGGHYGVVTDGEYIYTSNWGYSSAVNNFYKYDMEGNVIEGFNISGCGTLRGMTFDGQYVYGVANSSTIYCVDLNNHTLVGTTTSAYGAMRGITYDPARDGFWVIGNWSGNLTLIDRTGAIVQAGPAPTSASDLAYFADPDGVEHVFCFNNGTNDVDDYNIATNTITTAVFNFNSIPGYDGGTSGGCHVATYAGKTAFFGDLQQSPNLIGIYELAEGQPIIEGDFLGAMIFRDGELITPEPLMAQQMVDVNVPEGEHEYMARLAFGNAEFGVLDTMWYAMSCPVFATVNVEIECTPVNNLAADYEFDAEGNCTVELTWACADASAESFKVYRDGVFIGETADMVYTDDRTNNPGSYTYGVVAVYEYCESEMVTVDVTITSVEENDVVEGIYPNPTTGNLYIKAAAMQQITVANALGQVMMNETVSGDETMIDMSAFEAGVYMVRVATENGTTVKRISVVK